MGGAAPGPSCREAPACGRRRDEAGPSRGRRRFLPRERRIELYNEVLRLYGEGLGYRCIVRELHKRYGVSPPRPTISYWIRGIHTPYGRASGSEPPAASVRRPTQKISLEPNPELAYVIGAVLGDGYAFNGGHYQKIIALRAKDKEFVEEFARCLAGVLGRPVKVRFLKDRGLFDAKAYSAALYELLKKPVDLERLKHYIEHCDRCAGAFLRAFSDSEGYVINSKGHVGICNADLGLLTYVKELMGRIGIEVTGPRIKKQQGLLIDPKSGKAYNRRKCYELHVRARSNLVFHQKVGFTITRKMRRLEAYLLKHKLLPPSSLLFAEIESLCGGRDSNPRYQRSTLRDFSGWQASTPCRVWCPTRLDHRRSELALAAPPIKSYMP